MRLEDGTATLILMRHGETAWNREKRIMGDLDIALSEDGREQCVAAARLLADFDLHRIVTSPLARAAESARIVSQQLRLPVSEDQRLVEVRFGTWQGKLYSEVAEDPEYHAFATDPVSNLTPGGESISIVQSRGLASLCGVSAGENVLFVTHGDIIRSMLCHFLGTPLGEYRRIRTDNCGLSAIAIGPGMPEVKFLNVLADQRRATSATHWQGRA